MSLHIDVKYLKIASVRLDGFTEKGNYLYNCRCVFCGDSQKKKSKKRGYFYKKGNNLFFRCFNCEVSTTLYKTLEHLDPSLAKEYAVENYASNVNKHTPYEKPKNLTFTKPVFKKKSVDIDLPSISSLPDSHYAKKYVLERKIPKGLHKDLYFAKDFKSFVKEIFPEYDKELVEFDERLIIPFRKENGELFAFQGRAFSKNSLRYITIKMDADYPKVFGLDRINKKETIYVCEGPIDSLFVKNSIATADSNLMVADFLGKEKLVLVYDNEPRNSNICRQIEKSIKNGFTVCLFPDSFKGKDINESILNGFTKPEIQRMIDSCSYSGLRASIEFNNWKKV